MKKLRHEVIIRSIKIFDIFYITAITSLVGFFAAYCMDTYIFPPWNQKAEEAKPTWQLFLEIVGILGLFGTTTYILRNLVQLIPFPFEGVEGFVHHRVQEVVSGGSMGLFLFWFSTNLMNRIILFKQKITPNQAAHAGGWMPYASTM